MRHNGDCCLPRLVTYEWFLIDCRSAGSRSSRKLLRHSLGERAIDPERLAIEPVERELLELACERSGIVAAHGDREAALAMPRVRRFAIGRNEPQISRAQQQTRARISRQISPARSTHTSGIEWRDDGEADAKSELCQTMLEIIAHGQSQIDLDAGRAADQQSGIGVGGPQGVIGHWTKA